MRSFFRRNKTLLLLGFCVTILALAIATLILAWGDRVNNAQKQSQQNAIYLRERAALGNDRNEIIQRAFEAQCKSSNLKFSQIRQIEIQSFQQELADPKVQQQAKQDPKLFQEQVASYRRLIKILEPSDCSLKLTGNNPKKLHN